MHGDRRGDRPRRAARVLRRRGRRLDPGRAPHRRVPALRGRRTTPQRDRARAPSTRSNDEPKTWVFEQYDQLVGSRTVRRPGLDAAVLRIDGTRGIAVSLDGPPLGCRDPREAGCRAVMERAMNVACAGGEPLALTDCLNFGNPEKPEIGWELEQAIDGIAARRRRARHPRRLGQRLALQRDGRQPDPADAGRRLRRARARRDAHPDRWQRGDTIVAAPRLRARLRALRLAPRAPLHARARRLRRRRRARAARGGGVVGHVRRRTTCVDAMGVVVAAAPGVEIPWDDVVELGGVG